MAVQNYPPPKFVFNLAPTLLHASVAVAVLQALPAAPLTSPLRWFELILAVLVADLAGALMVSRRDHQHRRAIQGPQMWRDQLVPIAVVSPVVVSVGHHRAAAVLAEPLVVAAHRSRCSPSSGCSSGGSARWRARARASSGSTTSPAASSRSPPTRPARGRSSRPSASCSTPSASRSGCRPTSTRSRAWSSPPRTASVWYDGPGDPDDLFRRRAVAADRRARCWSRLPGPTTPRPRRWPAAGVSDLLGAPVITAAGEPGYLEVCDRRSDVVSFADSDRAALDSMLTHVNAAIRQQQLLTQIRYDADHDRLTGLPNRQRLAAEIDDAARRPTRSARAPA